MQGQFCGSSAPHKSKPVTSRSGTVRLPIRIQVSPLTTTQHAASATPRTSPLHRVPHFAHEFFDDVFEEYNAEHFAVAHDP